MPKRLSQSRTVVGIHAVLEAIQARPRAVRALWLRPGFDQVKALRDLRAQAEQFHIKAEIKPISFLDRLAVSHQGVGAVVDQSPTWDPSGLTRDQPTMV